MLSEIRDRLVGLCFIVGNGILENMEKRRLISVIKYIIAVFLMMFVISGMVCPVAATEAGDDETINILLVGNSLTKNRTHEEGNSIQGHLERMIEASGKQAYVETIAFNGGSLKNYAGMNPDKPKQAKRFRKKLKSADWDYVIIQERTALHYKGHEKKSLPAIKKIISMIQNQSPRAEIYYYVPRGFDQYSAYDGSVRMTAKQMEGYLGAAAARIGERFDIEVIPVNLMFYRCGLLYPNIQLIGDDDKHPNSAGVFFAAACIYQKIFDEVPKIDEEVLEFADISRKRADLFIGLWGKGMTSEQVEVILRPGEKYTMNVSFENKKEKSDVTYRSLNKKIAKVDSKTGEISAVKSGMTAIVAETKDGWQAYCTVYVPYGDVTEVKAQLHEDSMGQVLGIKLTWQKQKGARYEVYRSTSLSGRYEKIGSVRKPQFVDRTTTSGKDWYYKVLAVNEYASCAGNMSQAVMVSRAEEKKANIK